MVSPGQVGGRLGTSPCGASGPLTREWGWWGALERWPRGLTALGALRFLTVLCLTPWVVAIIAETRRFLVLFRGLHLPKLKIENVSSLFSGDPSRMQVSWFTKSNLE